MLRYRADLRSLVFIGSYYVFVGVGYTVELPNWALAILVILTSLVSFFCAVITHNTVHAPMWRNKTLNRFTQVLLTVTYGHPVSSYVPGHNLSHHRHTQTNKDLMRTHKLRFRWNLLNQIFFGWVVGPPILKANIEFVRRTRHKRPKWFRQFLVEAAVYFGYLGTMLALDWKLFLLLVVIPHQYAAWGIMGINYVQHDGCDPESPWNHSRNFTGKLVNWFTFNNGYHGLHHMKPSLHWSKLPEVHAKELAPHIHPELDQTSLLRYLFTAYFWPGKRVRFDGQPVQLPPLEPDEAWIPEPKSIDADNLGAAH